MKAETKSAIRSALAELISSLATERSLTPEEVANESFYFLQRHPTWGRNPSATQKRASHRHWNGQCHRCVHEVAFVDATFHHLKRGIPHPHAPENLVPECMVCHDREHGVSHGSLSKGSPRGRK